MKHANVWALAAVAATLLLGGCKGDAAEAKAEETPKPMIVSPENVAVAERTELQAGPTLSGSLTAERSAQVRAEIGGAVIDVAADQGLAVKEGQVLARIDASAIQDAYLGARAGLRTAESNLQLSRRNAERSEQLLEAGAVSERDAEQARLALHSAEGALADAKARLAQAQEQLSDATVRAPFRGIVGTKDVSEGDVVNPGTLLFTVIDPATMRLEASVPVEDYSAIRTGTPVEFRVAGLERQRFTGKVTRVSPVVDPATRQVRIVASIPNTGNRLLAGLFAEGRVATSTREGIVVPMAAVDDQGVRPLVRRVRGGRVERVEVTLGLRDRATERVEVATGLAAGDTLLVGAAAGIAAGTPVTVRRVAAPPETAAGPQRQGTRTQPATPAE